MSRRRISTLYIQILKEKNTVKNETGKAKKTNNESEKRGVELLYGKAKLYRTQGNDEDTKNDGDRSIAKDLSGRTHNTGLPRSHPIPTSGM